MNRKRWLYAVAALLALLVLGSILDPSQTVRALVRGEAFYQWRPTRYWREVLRADGEKGKISDESIKRLRKKAACPVLIQCSMDKDPNVCWPAIGLLGELESRELFPSSQALVLFREGLNSEHEIVRFQSARAIGLMGIRGRSASEDLVHLLQDPSISTRCCADYAIWQIDQSSAPKLTGWKEFNSMKWRFSAVFPSQIEEKQTVVDRLETQVLIHSFTGVNGVTHCIVAVSDYQEDILKQVTEAQRFDNARDWVVAQLGGKVVIDEQVEQNGLKGREQEIAVEGMGFLRTRHFWVGNRLYNILVASTPEFVNRKAAEYFLNSLKIVRPEDS
jgi:hypothetical protein